MSALTIFLEGEADKKFVSDLILAHFGEELDIQFILFKGKDRWAKNRVDFEKSTYAERINLLIFDADGDPETTRQNILQKKEELGVEFEMFLFPDNQNSGELEDLLIQIVSDRAGAIFTCFEAYKDCIHGVNSDYTKPDLKTKIFAYSEILTGNGKEKERDYTNPEIWNLKSPSLTPLLNFLKKHLPLNG